MSTVPNVGTYRVGFLGAADAAPEHYDFHLLDWQGSTLLCFSGSNNVHYNTKSFASQNNPYQKHIIIQRNNAKITKTANTKIQGFSEQVSTWTANHGHRIHRWSLGGGFSRPASSIYTYEFMVFPRLLSDLEVADLMSYQQTKYNIT
jgi:hypothetical protein